jgi:hypothetical protein
MYDELSDIELETDWIQEFEKIVDERLSYPLEKMKFLRIYSLYVDKDFLFHVSSQKVSWEETSDSLLDFLRKRIQDSLFMKWMTETTEFIGSPELAEKQKQSWEKGCFLSDVMLFNVEDEMSIWEKETEGAMGDLGKLRENYFRAFSWKEWDALESLEWKDSVFLFHPVNTIYFVFRKKPGMNMEVIDLEQGGVLDVVEMPVSILLPSSGEGGESFRKTSRGKTQKVRFVVDSDSEVSEVSEVSEDSEDSEGDEEDPWGKGYWIRQRRQSRHKTMKRKHVLSPALIRSLFQPDS